MWRLTQLHERTAYCDTACSSYFLRPVGMGYVGAGPRLPTGRAATLLLTKGPRKTPLGLAANVWNNCKAHEIRVNLQPHGIYNQTI